MTIAALDRKIKREMILSPRPEETQKGQAE